MCIRTPRARRARAGLSDDLRFCDGADTAGASPGAVAVAPPSWRGTGPFAGAGVGCSRGAGAAAAVGASFGEGGASTGASLGAGAGAGAVGASLGAAAAGGAPRRGAGVARRAVGAVGASVGAAQAAAAAPPAAPPGPARPASARSAPAPPPASEASADRERPLFTTNTSAKARDRDARRGADPDPPGNELRDSTHRSARRALDLHRRHRDTGGFPIGLASAAIGDGIAVSPALSCGASPAANHAPSSASTSGVSVRTNERGGWTSTSTRRRRRRRRRRRTVTATAGRRRRRPRLQRGYGTGCLRREREQRLPQLPHRRKSRLGIRTERAQHDRVHFLGNVRPARDRRNRVPGGDRPEDLVDVVPAVGRLARQTFVEDDAQGVLIAGGTCRLVIGDLLGGEVVRRSEHRSPDRCRAAGVAPRGPRPLPSRCRSRARPDAAAARGSGGRCSTA